MHRNGQSQKKPSVALRSTIASVWLVVTIGGLGAQNAEPLTIQQILMDGQNRAGSQVKVWGIASDVEYREANNGGNARQISSFSLRDGRYSAYVSFTNNIPGDLFLPGDPIVIRYELTVYYDNVNKIHLGQWGSSFYPDSHLVGVGMERPSWDPTERRDIPETLSVADYVIRSYRLGSASVKLTGEIREFQRTKVLFSDEENFFIQLISPGTSVTVSFLGQHWAHDPEMTTLLETLKPGDEISAFGYFSEETSIGSSFRASDIELLRSR